MKKLRMKQLIPAICIAVVIPVSANEAVQDFNGSVALSYLHSTHFSNTEGELDFRIPLGYNLGLGIHGGLENRDGRNNEYPDYDSSEIGAQAFVRQKNLYKAGFDYTSKTIDPKRGDREDIDLYTLFGEYYYQQFNFTGKRVHSNREYDRNGDSWTVGMNYYADPNIRLDLEVGGMDERDTYTIRANLQPKPLNNTASVNFGYIHGRANDSIFAGIQYYFGATTSMNKRDRTYR